MDDKDREYKPGSRVAVLTLDKRDGMMGTVCRPRPVKCDCGQNLAHKIKIDGNGKVYVCSDLIARLH